MCDLITCIMTSVFGSVRACAVHVPQSCDVNQISVNYVSTPSCIKPGRHSDENSCRNLFNLLVFRFWIQILCNIYFSFHISL